MNKKEITARPLFCEQITITSLSTTSFNQAMLAHEPGYSLGIYMNILLLQHLLNTSGSISAFVLMNNIFNHFRQCFVFNGSVAFSAVENSRRIRNVRFAGFYRPSGCCILSDVLSETEISHIFCFKKAWSFFTVRFPFPTL